MELEVLKQSLSSMISILMKLKMKDIANSFHILFAIIEKQNEEIEFLKTENQKLRDEINLLKGEQIKPKILGSKKNEDLSSEKERRNRDHL